MQIYIHRINTIEQLSAVPEQYGIEIVIRGWGSELYLHHDPLKEGEEHCRLEDMLQVARNHAGIIFSTKEAGYEDNLSASKGGGCSNGPLVFA